MPLSKPIAVLADVHGNYCALEAVLADIKSKGIKRIWNLGDMVGYGAQPDKCVKTLIDRCEFNIGGNYDHKVLKYGKKKGKWEKTKHPLKLAAQAYAYENLSEASKQMILETSASEELKLHGRRLLLCHGSPADYNEALWEYTPRERLIEVAIETPVDIILSGHIHTTFARMYANTWFLNTSTVGRAEDLDPRACYATLQLDEKDPKLPPVWIWHRVEYDIDKAIKLLKKSGQPEVYQHMLRHAVTMRYWQELYGED